ncbi:MAG: maleylpyruvate isomerase N-terminal domain-containing protein [Actinomycetota bacterium]
MSDLEPPPVDLGARIAQRARTVRPPGRPIGLGALPTGRELYAAMTTRLGALLDDLTIEEWTTPVQPYGWSVGGLVGHLIAIDDHTVDAHRDAVVHDEASRDHLAMTRTSVEEHDGGDAATTLAAWTASSARVAGLGGGDRTVRFHGAPLASETVLVIRAFEVWTHSDDVRRAVDRPVVDPTPEQVHVMSERSLAMATRADLGTLRLVLTGPGGGTWQLGRPVPPGEELALLVLDAVDYCRFAARRLDRDDLDVEIGGAAGAAEGFLTVARSMAL